MPKRGTYTNIDARYSMQPRDIWKRLIFTYPPNTNEVSRLGDFEAYLRAREAIIDQQYFAICDDKDRYDSLRKEAERLDVSLQQRIPLQKGEGRTSLESKFLPIDSAACQHSDDGWLYLFFDEGNICLYVGLTSGHNPLRRVGSHYDTGDKERWHIHLQEKARQSDGWTIKFVRPSDCDALIRKSFFLPCEVEQGIPDDFEKQYQEKRALKRCWWLRRAERVLIAVYHPQFNSDGKPLDETTSL